MSSKYTRLKTCSLEELGICTKRTLRYVCVFKELTIWRRGSTQSLTCVLFWNWKQVLLYNFSYCLKTFPRRIHRGLQIFGPWAHSGQGVHLAAPGPGLAPCCSAPKLPVTFSDLSGLNLHLRAQFLWLMASVLCLLPTLRKGSGGRPEGICRALPERSLWKTLTSGLHSYQHMSDQRSENTIESVPSHLHSQPLPPHNQCWHFDVYLCFF